MESRWRFKGQTVCSRFNAANLTCLERKRLLRAFLRYQLNSLMDRNVQQLCKESLHRHSGQKFQPWDLQAILCVDEYLKTLDAAMFAQYSDSGLPEIVLSKGSTSSHLPGLLYPDSLCVDPEAYAHDMGCGHYIASWFTYGGLDLVTILLRSTEPGQTGRDRLKEWFENFHQIYDSRRERSHYLIEGYDSIGRVLEGSESGPGMYRTFHSRIIPNYMTLTRTSIQRAWVFLDDARFYPPPSSDASPHFLTEDEALEERYQTMKKDEDYWDLPWRARARHRSQKWHNEMSPEKTKVQDYQDSEPEKEFSLWTDEY
ncbi:hypothetical protein CTAM01_12343 [Colletotrichum tamarilloi]|uniref:Uncharacterized protein n=1 Tax=Colletotrichum tamarilloi TaxID=1209934 RepID=A0ABQ9QVB3_9PEZI|nr:uncharacterized protein CTAM01_12343 [Colletotrichum tamarilloi]KAK1485973.1 hypothetical protein CTAM01_12343 [Colletotrichum tamarilloi]